MVTAGHCIKNKLVGNLNVTLGEVRHPHWSPTTLQYHIGEELEAYPSRTYRVAAMVVHPNFQFSPAADRCPTKRQ